MLDRFPEDSMQDIDKRSMIWLMFMSSTLEASVVFMGKSYSDNLHSIKTWEILTLKQMFEISEQLILEQSQISLESSTWKQLSMVNNEEVISLSHAKVSVFSDSVLCLRKMNQNPTSNTAWERQLEWFKSSPEYRILDRIDGEPMEFEWNIFRGFTALQLVQEVQKFMNRMGEHQQLQGRNIFMSMFNDIKWRSKDNVLRTLHLCLYSQKDFQQDVVIPWTWIRKKWYSTHESKPQKEWDRVAELLLIKFGESGHPVFRATSPLSRRTLKSKGGGKLSIHFCADGDTIETVSRCAKEQAHRGLSSGSCVYRRPGAVAIAWQQPLVFGPGVWIGPIAVAL